MLRGMLRRIGIIVLWISVWMGWGSAVGAQEPIAADTQSGVQVVFQGRPLFRVYSNLASYTPRDRAEVIPSRLRRVAENVGVALEAIQIRPKGNRLDIVAGESVIASVTEADASAAGRSQRVMAEEYREVIRRAIDQYRQERSRSGVVRGVAYGLLTTLVLLAVMRLLGHAARALRQRIERMRGRQKVVTEPGHLNDFVASHLTDPLLHLISIIYGVLVVVIFGSYLILVLGFLPWTKPLGYLIQDYIHAHVRTIGIAFLNHLPDMLFLLLIALIAHFLLNLAFLIFSGIERGSILIFGLERELAMPMYRFTRILVITLSGAAMFPYIPGSKSAAFQGISVFVGALLTLGSTSVVANLIAGMVLTFLRPFRIGDRVRIGETIGDVMAKTDMVTRIRTTKNEEITIPNSLVLSSHVINYSALARSQGLILHTSVSIGYDTPWRQVHALLLEAASATPTILEEPAPFILQTALNDFFVTYELNAYTRLPNQMSAIYSELHQNIQDKFNEAGVEIMSPHYTNLRDGNTTTVPEKFREAHYVSPMFRVEAVSQEVSEK